MIDLQLAARRCNLQHKIDGVAYVTPSVHHRLLLFTPAAFKSRPRRRISCIGGQQYCDSDFHHAKCHQSPPGG